MERAGGDRAVDAERVEPVDELARGPPRERDREHVARLGVLLADPERDAAGEHARLARPGGREDRERRVRLGDGRALVRVEIGEQRVGVTHGCDRTGRLRRTALRVDATVGQAASGRGKAPSSLRCVAAPISSGPVPRPPFVQRRQALAGARAVLRRLVHAQPRRDSA